MKNIPDWKGDNFVKIWYLDERTDITISLNIHRRFLIHSRVYGCCVFRPANGCSVHRSLVVIFALFYTFYDLKVYKKLFYCRKIDLDQRTACGAPVCWSKYTTYCSLVIPNKKTRVKWRWSIIYIYINIYFNDSMKLLK